MIDKHFEALMKSWGYGKPKYTFEIEVVEGENSTCHQVGEKFEYSKDRGIICPWLLDSMSGLIRVLEFGGSLP